MTKTEMFETLKNVVADSDLENKVEIVEMLDASIAQLANRAAKSRERAAAKRAETDEMRAAILATLTTDPQSVEDILAKVANYPEITKAKVVSRLTTLVNDGYALKDVAKDEETKKKVTVYWVA